MASFLYVSSFHQNQINYFRIQDNFKLKTLQLRYWGDYCHSYLLRNDLLRNKTADILNLQIFENDQYKVKSIRKKKKCFN
jgi:hypothetical protein